jgi:hypothetical protein
MAGIGNGVKNSVRLTAYLTPLTLYRTVSTQDGAVTPSSPPSIPTIDVSSSAKALNELALFVRPSGTCTIQLWAIADSAWYFVVEKALTSARPEVVVVKDLPACKWAVVVTACNAAVSISEAHSE